MDRESILKLAGLLGIKAARGRGANILLQCPFAEITGGHASADDARPSFSVLVDDAGPSACNCFGCGTRGTLVSVLAKAARKHDGFDEALAFAKRVEKYDLERGLERALHHGPRIREREGEGAALSRTLARFVRACQVHVPGYALERGLTRHEIERWNVGLDVFEYRVTFPVWDRDGSLVGVMGRTVVEGVEPKYLAYHQFSTGEHFYGEHDLDMTVDEAVIVEGGLDTIVTRRFHPNALGLLGLRLTPEKRKKLKKWFSSVTLLLDSDAAGTVQALSEDVFTIRMGLWLSKVMRLYVAMLPSGEDPASAPDAVPTALKNRVLWDSLGLDKSKLIC